MSDNLPMGKKVPRPVVPWRRAEAEKRVAVKEDAVSRVYGIAGKGNTDEIMRQLRGQK